MTQRNTLDPKYLRAWKTIPQLAEETGFSYDSVKNALVELMRERKVLMKKLEPDGKTPGPRPTAYRLAG